MRPDRNAPAEGLIDLPLARRVGQVIVAADDVGHAHVVIVDDDGEHVGPGNGILRAETRVRFQAQNAGERSNSVR